MKKQTIRKQTHKGLQWLEIRWPRPLEIETAQEVIARLATSGQNNPLIFEVRANKSGVRYLLGAELSWLKQIAQILESGVPGIRLKPCISRREVTYARRVKASRPQLALNTQNTLSVIRATLASLAQIKQDGEEAVLQIVLGRPYTPSLLPNKLTDPEASWLDVLRGTVASASSESRKLLHDKVNFHGFQATIRIGTLAKRPITAIHMAQRILSGLKIMESAGAKLFTSFERSVNFNTSIFPWRYPMRLSIKELTGFLCWPLGDGDLPGLAGIHPRVLLPPKWLSQFFKHFVFAICYRLSRSAGFF